jgi:uncharacterized protein YecT (DUF1311 family)
MAQEQEPCNGTTHPEIVACLFGKYQLADQELNKVYAKFIVSASKDNQKSIKPTQIKWIQFKEKYCQKLYDELYPGQEAEYDKYACLRVLTEDRTSEINRTMSLKKFGTWVYDDFEKMLSVLFAAGYKRQEIIKKITAYANLHSDRNWNAYVQATCKFSTTYAEDHLETCEARLHFHYISNRGYIRFF